MTAHPPAYYLNRQFRDWYTGMILDHYTGRVLVLFPDMTPALMRTWHEGLERCWAAL